MGYHFFYKTRDRTQNYFYLERADKNGSPDCKEEEKTNDAQAPGKPTKEDGFVPPKRWDGKKVRHPKTGQYGWPDDKGKVWVPTGPGALAHGGPHWDVIDKSGDHINVMPGGKIRGQK